MIRVIGDDIYFDEWKIGRLLDIVPATIRDQFVSFIEAAGDPEDVEERIREAEAAAYERGCIDRSEEW